MMQANMSAPMQTQVPTMPQQQPPGSQQQQAQVQQQQGDPDPISRFKALLPRVRESIANLFKEAALIVRQNAAQDCGSHQDIQRIDRERSDRFEKRLEDVFALIDQMEISLKLALELHHQALDSMKNTPQSVMISKPPEHTSPAAPQEGQSYAQYLTTMRMQISFAKDLHDILTEASTKLLDKSLPPPPAPAVSAAGPSMPGSSQSSQQQHTPLSQQQHTPSSQD